MGLLDDLKNQAEKQLDPTGTVVSPLGAEEFYREHVKSRMCSAFSFLSELVTQLNAMNLQTRAEYPFRPDGAAVALLQQDYKVYSDNIPEPRQITLSFYCALLSPTAFEVNGRGMVLALCELLDRYRFKYDKHEQKDPRQLVTGAKIRLSGPLAVKLVFQFDESKHLIKLLVSNFAGPGTSQYNLKPAQLDASFLERFGKYILRQESALFEKAVAEDVKAMLRKKLQDEQQQREAELQHAEDARKAEAVIRKQNSTTEQVKKAVSQAVSKNTEKLKQAMHEQLGDKTDKLKNIFEKLKSQIVPKKS